LLRSGEISSAVRSVFFVIEVLQPVERLYLIAAQMLSERVEEGRRERPVLAQLLKPQNVSWLRSNLFTAALGLVSTSSHTWIVACR